MSLGFETFTRFFLCFSYYLAFMSVNDYNIV